MRTGGLDPIEIDAYGEPAVDIRFVAGNADGDELWKATSEAGFKYYRWDAADGWHASALVERAPDADTAGWTPGVDGSVVSADGNHVALRPWVDGGPGGDFVTIIDYRLAADDFDTHTFEGFVGLGDLMDVAWRATESLAAYVEHTIEVGGEDQAVSDPVKLFLDGSGRYEFIDQSDLVGTGDRWRFDVLYGAPSDPSAGHEECGC